MDHDKSKRSKNKFTSIPESYANLCSYLFPLTVSFRTFPLSLNNHATAIVKKREKTHRFPPYSLHIPINRPRPTDPMKLHLCPDQIPPPPPLHFSHPSLSTTSPPVATPISKPALIAYITTSQVLEDYLVEFWYRGGGLEVFRTQSTTYGLTNQNDLPTFSPPPSLSNSL